MSEAILNFARNHPGRALVLFIATHALLWTLVPALTFTSPPGDIVELHNWGAAWLLGYPKLPPLPVWLLGVAHALPGGGVWTAYLLSQIALAITFVAVFLLARPMIGPAGALVAVLLLEGVFYFTTPALEFNHNVVQMPLWALATLHFHRALTSGSRRYWLYLAVEMALLAYTKYSGGLLAIAFALIALTTEPGRAALRMRWPYLAAAGALVLAAPHIVWLVLADFSPIDYAMQQDVAASFGESAFFAARFLAAQLLDHAAMFALAAVAVAGRPRGKADAPVPQVLELAPASSFDRTFVALIVLAPPLMAAALSLALGIAFKTMWGAPMFAFSGLGLLLLAGGEVRIVRARSALALLLMLILATPVGYSAVLWTSPLFTHKPHRMIWPAEEVGRVATEVWRLQSNRPLDYVIGNFWIGGLVALYGPDRPRLIEKGSLEASPWVDPADFRRRGGLIAWQIQDETAAMPALYTRLFPGAVEIGRRQVAWPLGLPIAPIELGFALVPPGEGE